MQRVLPMLALALSLHAAHATEARAATAHAVQANAVMHASLTVGSPAQPAQRQEPTERSTPAATSAEAKKDEERHPTTAMLVAALALMIAIALRRWGVAQQ